MHRYFKPVERFSTAPTVDKLNRHGTAATSQPPPTDDVRGTDTPPEKVPRRVLPANFAPKENNSGPSLFESIMHKFVKVDDNERITKRYASFFSFSESLA